MFFNLYNGANTTLYRGFQREDEAASDEFDETAGRILRKSRTCDSLRNIEITVAQLGWGTLLVTLVL